MLNKKQFQQDLLLAWCPSKFKPTGRKGTQKLLIHDLSGNIRHGVNAASSANEMITEHGTAGGPDGLYAFDCAGSTNRFYQVTEGGLQDWAAEEGTIKTWFYPHSTNTSNYLIGRNAVGLEDGGIAIYFSTASRVTGFIETDSTFSLCDMTGTVSLNEWHMAALTWRKDDECALWIDGVKQADVDTTVTELLAHGSRGFAWGAPNWILGGTPNEFDGLLDDFTIWERQLGESEMELLFELGRGGWIQNKQVPIFLGSFSTPPITVTLAAETDSALSIQPLRTYNIGLSSETDSATSFTRRTKLFLGNVKVLKTLRATVRK